MTVALFTLGGTISMAGVAPDGDGVVARLTGRDLTAAVPGLADLGEDLEIHDVEAVPSASLTFAQVLDVAAAASRAIEAGARGVVLSQGTDTLEETAFLVDLVWAHAEPFVVTGAMRNPTLAGPDGPANLLAAARVAASPDARDLGALVVLNDEIHAARWVGKQHSTSTATFGSPDAGPLGHVIEGRVRLLTRPLRKQPLSAPDHDRLAARRVALHVVSLEDDGDRLDGLADTHDGLVVAGFGVGHVPAALAPRLGALAERIPVVLTSRTGGGSVLTHTYGAPGSEVDLLRRGLVNGGLLDPYKARILLRLLLAAGSDGAAIAREFAERG
ncbi:asparaginase [Nocardioides ungokensis]|uniref:asparaginase n=1 Tax=Nocardioides ungokensis TaxID=1643322 RepID=UPI0015DF874D|nr:asparaginase [Nocardioides ungokensis]